jgi:GAF domain-containing protein
VTAFARFRSAYLAALQEHVLEADERTLQAGYELGRTAVAQNVGALDLAVIHHEGLQSSIRSAPQEECVEIIAAAGAFFQETLSTFEMVHRGYLEAATAAAEERRHATMLRRLSSFLADASLSARHPDAAAEVLQLVAEHARELTDSSHAVACWRSGQELVRATSSDLETPPTAAPGVLDHLEHIGPALPDRISRSEWPKEPMLRALGTVHNVLTVPITALDDRRLGLLQLVDRKRGDFTDSDEAVARHLADMTAAAFERAELYRRQPARY